MLPSKTKRKAKKQWRHSYALTCSWRLSSRVKSRVSMTGRSSSFAAGFNHYKITPNLGLWSLIEAYP
ncbi:hypothetical protein CISIN_1g041850mg [Citrus sinensis]|uniref:Uncharacterized protein n=1 Tax=Citrus sinensis TaxID=2711 RepID=A0A067DYB7_CITSI|nr:hypothetical protein CISIN_1g041850mg [Citrus sinensis]